MRVSQVRSGAGQGAGPRNTKRGSLGLRAMATDRVQTYRSDMPDMSVELIAGRRFAQSWRGYDPDEVKDFLTQVAAQVRSLRERIDFEVSVRREAEQRALHPQIDEAMLMSAVGEQTAAILRSARSAAAEITARAEETAASLISAAEAKAAEVVAEGEAQVANRTAEAEASANDLWSRVLSEVDQLRKSAQQDAEVLAEQATQKYEEVVEGAEAVREKILTDLARRRNLATVQIEQLRAGRERLLDAYLVVRSTLDDVTGELQRVDAEARAATVAVGRTERHELSGELGDLWDPVSVFGGSDTGDTTGEVPPVVLAPRVTQVATPPTLPAPPARRVPQKPNGPNGPNGKDVASQDPVNKDVANKDLANRDLTSQVATTSPSKNENMAEALAAARQAAALAGPGDPAIIGRGDAIESVRVLLPEPPKAEGHDAEAEPDAVVDLEAAGLLAEPEDDAPPAVEPDVVVGPEAEVLEVEALEVEALEAEELEAEAPVADVLEVDTPEADVPGVGPTSSVEIDTSATTWEEPESELPQAIAAEPDANPDTDASLNRDASQDKDVEGLFARIRASREEATLQAKKTLAGENGTQAVEEAAAGPGAPGLEGAPENAPVADVSEAVVPGLAPQDITVIDAGRSEAEEGATLAPAEGVEAETAAPDVEPDTAARLFERRDQVVSDLGGSLARKLKRALQDQQNSLLDRLRNMKSGTAVADLLPGEDSDRFAEAGRALLAQAARSGAELAAALFGAGAAPRGAEQDGVDDLADELGQAIAGPLHQRLELAVRSAGDDPSEVASALSAAYREWKTQRIEAVANDEVAAAFAHGAYLSFPDGAALRWVVDQSEGPCPDCEDNALAGDQARGQAWPTGQLHPPAHPGCRCALAPVPARDGTALSSTPSSPASGGSPAS